MSRTIRRKTHRPSYCHFFWVLRNHDTDAIVPPQLDRKSKEGRKRLAHFHSDSGSWKLEPGPSWFRNLTTERPQRREAKQQIHRYMKDPEFEVILNPMDPLDYWS